MDYGSILRQQVTDQQQQLRQSDSNRHDIAIVGMACRFPGADNLSEYWELLSSGVDAVDEIPTERWDWRDYYDVDPEAAGKMYNRWGGFLKNIDRFDPLFFRIAPREAELMDPQHRLFLETAWRALEHAGYAGDALVGSNTGVFAGCTNTHYSRRYQLARESDDYYLAALGNWNAALASRVSYFLDLHGPSLLVDTLCSSSLSAMHAACNSIRKKECSAALVGGVNLILTPEHFIAGSKLRAHSADGRCKTFDHRANGFTSGEGVGVALLKPLTAALEDHDTIYAVVKGSAVNHDGQTNGIMAPNPKAQARVVLSALDDADVAADSISYIECHGTGTSLGDPIEIEGLTKAFRSQTQARQFCAVGSVKSNIGHLEPAAGIAGLIKILLGFQHRQIPPSLHYEKPNPHIDFPETPFFVNSRLTQWDSQGPRRAGISSFGLSGINAHLILEEPPESAKNSGDACDAYLLPLSARSEKALTIMVSRYQQHLSNYPEISLADLCWTAAVGNAHHKHRLALVAGTREDFISLLEQLKVIQERPESKLPGVFRGTVTETDLASVHLSAGSRDAVSSINSLEELASSYVKGQAMSWDAINRVGQCRHVPLPPYPFDYVRCWPEDDDPVHGDQAAPMLDRIQQHPFLGRRLGGVV